MSRLSHDAETVLEYLVCNGDPRDDIPAETIAQEVNLHGARLDDALHELQATYLARRSSGMGGQISVTPSIWAWEHVDAAVLGYDIRDDMMAIARALTAQPATYGKSWADASTLQQLTGLPERRLNIAALLLAERNAIQLTHSYDTQPYAFSTAMADHWTRRWLEG